MKEEWIRIREAGSGSEKARLSLARVGRKKVLLPSYTTSYRQGGAVKDGLDAFVTTHSTHQKVSKKGTCPLPDPRTL